METGSKHKTAIHKLTALWALCESGLGGWMHALKLPFTGFFLGAFSIIIISLIAWHTDKNAQKIIKATVIVLLIKAAVSPQSSPAAYIAVAFQGLTGALFFRFINFRLAAILLGIITMLESALQMVLVKTIIFGMALWEAIDLLSVKVAHQFHLDISISFSTWLIGAYLLLYASWGLALGIWIGKLPLLIAKRKANTLARINGVLWNKNYITPKGKEKKQQKILLLFLTLLFIVAVFLAGRQGQYINRTVYILLRTIAVIALFYWVINPMINRLMQIWVAKRKKDHEFNSVMNSLPEMKLFIRPAYDLAKDLNGWKRYREFVLVLLILTLYAHELENK